VFLVLSLAGLVLLVVSFDRSPFSSFSLPEILMIPAMT
jgi:hypothetical protein